MSRKSYFYLINYFAKIFKFVTNLKLFCFHSCPEGPRVPEIKSLGAKETTKNEKKAKEMLNLVENEPTLMIKIKLMEGTSINVEANENHKIADLRKYVIM